MLTHRFGRLFLGLIALAFTTAASAESPAPAPTEQVGVAPPIYHKVQLPHEHMEMTVNSSRILECDQRIPRVQVGNRELVDIMPLSDKQIQIYAKKIGVTEINLWDEKGKSYAINLLISGDARQLALMLRTQFPTSSIRVVPSATSVILSGYVDRADYISRIQKIAEDYYPKVINNITVGGSQQVLLHVKVMEVSRTKLRDLGVDFADVTSGGSFVKSSISGLLKSASPAAVTSTGAETFAFGIIDTSNAFFALLNALQRNQLMKILAEPTLVTVSGRPAYFVSGGEIPILIPQSLGTVSIEFRKFGTQVDFVPIVLGNGNVRLEVRPRVSEIDPTISVTLNGSTIPGFRTREVDTGVELRVGQTLAIAGLIQTREESKKDGLPWISDLPYVGVPFRRVNTKKEEIELLILVRPELSEGMECEEVPPGGPGMNSTLPNDWQLYMRGHIEVPYPPAPDAGYVTPPLHIGVGPDGRPNRNPNMGGPAPGPDMGPEAGPAMAPPDAQSEEIPMPAPPVVAPSAQNTRRPAATAAGDPQLAQPGPPSSRRRSTAQKSDPSRPKPYNPSPRQARKTPAGSNAVPSRPELIGPVGYDVGN